MPPDWLRIKKAREDLTDYVIHSTRGTSKDGTFKRPIEVLKEILELGYLRPSFAPRASVTANRPPRNTVMGKIPVVCFTEQPLSAFIRSFRTLGGRYRPYGVAVRKDRLFDYGGRPVLYGDEQLLEALPASHKHLWVNFQPIPNADFGGYPLDWTHEREWRTPVQQYHVLKLGTYPKEGVPLLLPPSGDTLTLPWVLVRSCAEAEELRTWIQEMPEYEGSNKMTMEYRKRLPNVPILPLEVVEAKLLDGNPAWSRLDTLPLWELYPDSVSNFRTIGWSKL